MKKTNKTSRNHNIFHYKKYYFLLSIILLLPYFIVANPLYTPKNSDSIINPETGEITTDAPEVLPVRIAGGNSSLIKKQGILREKLANVFVQFKKNTSTSSHSHLLWLVFSLSFAYGILHASGPGHRKTIVFSLYLTRNAPWWEPAIVALLLAFLHGSSAIILMFIFKGVAGSVAQNTDNITLYMEGLTYVLLILTTIWLIFHETREYIQQKTKVATKSSHVSLIPFIVSGVYPCPGAILVLVLCFSLGLLNLGAISVLIMSLGMAIPITAAGYLAWSGRTGLFHALKANEQTAAKLAYIVQMCGFTILLTFSLYISWPFLYSLVV
jgi:ABC-type nickel/cobalt efflux system permease component RcnA